MSRNRKIYVPKPLGGNCFRINPSDNITATAALDEHTLFVGTQDGYIHRVLYEEQKNQQASHYNQGSDGNEFLDFEFSQVAKKTKEVKQLQVVEAWGVLVAIIDGYVEVFDLRKPFRSNCQLVDSKGCTIFATCHALGSGNRTGDLSELATWTRR